MISDKVVILTKEEFDSIKDEYFQRGVKRGEFENSCQLARVIQGEDLKNLWEFVRRIEPDITLENGQVLSQKVRREHLEINFRAFLAKFMESR
jgi:predicted RNase H-like nuclease